MRPDAFRLALLLIASAARSADVAPDDAWLREREGYYAALDRVGLRALAPLLERVFVASSAERPRRLAGPTVLPPHGHAYAAYSLPLASRDFETARREAERLGGHLATLTTLEENEGVYGMLRGCAACWVNNNARRPARGWMLGPFLGARRERDGGDGERGGGGWRWVTGEPWAAAQWLPGQPNGVGPTGEDCLIMAGERGRTSPGWNDFACGAGGAGAGLGAWLGRPKRPAWQPELRAFVVEWATADAADRACRASPSALDDPS